MHGRRFVLVPLAGTRAARGASGFEQNHPGDFAVVRRRFDGQTLESDQRQMECGASKII
jgi:hypothetical protein